MIAKRPKRSGGSEYGRTSAPDGRELRSMTSEQLSRLAADLDEVDVVAHTSEQPEPGSRAEKRAEWSVVLWFVLSALSAGAFVAAYILWPDEYAGPFEDGHVLYSLYTPVVGGTFGLAVLTLGIGVIMHIKKFFPEEIAVQRRHGGSSDELARTTAMVRIGEVVGDTDVARRPLIKRVMIGAFGLFGAATGVLAIGGFVRDPWRGGDQGALRVTGWKSFGGETVYLRSHSVLGDVVRVRPEDLEPGAMVTVFPFRESDRGDAEALLAAERASDAPVMLIRLQPGTPVVKRSGQENFNYGDYYAFSKICTHLGCPASQYDSRNHITLCPCHQSEFLITRSARPIFGPAVRPLPQLPITVDDEGYFVAEGDFIEPIGPGFWERRAR